MSHIKKQKNKRKSPSKNRSCSSSAILPALISNGHAARVASGLKKAIPGIAPNGCIVGISDDSIIPIITPNGNIEEVSATLVEVNSSKGHRTSVVPAIASDGHIEGVRVNWLRPKNYEIFPPFNDIESADAINLSINNSLAQIKDPLIIDAITSLVNDVLEQQNNSTVIASAGLKSEPGIGHKDPKKF